MTPERLRAMTSTGFFPESQLANFLLDGLRGTEIGPPRTTRLVCRQFQSDSVNSSIRWIMRNSSEQLNRCGKVAEIDISADPSSLPIPDGSTDFVIPRTSGNTYLTVSARLRNGCELYAMTGYIFVVVPKHDALTSDRTRPVTSIQELIIRRNSGSEAAPSQPATRHRTVFLPELFFEIEGWFN